MRTLMQYEIPVVSGGLTNGELAGVGIGTLIGGALMSYGIYVNMALGPNVALGLAVSGGAATGGLIGLGIAVLSGYLWTSERTSTSF